MGLQSSITGVSLKRKRGKFGGRHTQKQDNVNIHEGRQQCDNQDTDTSNASINQGTPRASKS